MSDKAFAVKYCAGLFIKSLPYYAALALFALYLCKNLKAPPSARNALAAAPVLAAALTLPFMVTDRYHYPMMPVVWIYAGAALAGLLRSGENRAPEILPAKPLGGRNGSASDAPSILS